MGRSLAITVAVLFAFTAGGPKPAGAQTSSAGVTIMQSCANGEPFCFSPPTLTVADGTTVTWSNQTGVAHTVTRCDPVACGGVAGGTGTDATFTTANLDAGSGAKFTHAFNGPGTYNYYCAIHGYALMHGTVTVTAATPTTTTPTTTTTASTAPGSTARGSMATGSPPPNPGAPTRVASSANPAVNPSATPATTSKQLARTGSTTHAQLATAAILLGLGLALIAAGIRRRRPLI
jgi:plastocyanin